MERFTQNNKVSQQPVTGSAGAEVSHKSEFADEEDVVELQRDTVESTKNNQRGLLTRVVDAARGKAAVITLAVGSLLTGGAEPQKVEGEEPTRVMIPASELALYQEFLKMRPNETAIQKKARLRQFSATEAYQQFLATGIFPREYLQEEVKSTEEVQENSQEPNNTAPVIHPELKESKEITREQFQNACDSLRAKGFLLQPRLGLDLDKDPMNIHGPTGLPATGRRTGVLRYATSIIPNENGLFEGVQPMPLHVGSTFSAGATVQIVHIPSGEIVEPELLRAVLANNVSDEECKAAMIHYKFPATAGTEYRLVTTHAMGMPSFERHKEIQQAVQWYLSVQQQVSTGSVAPNVLTEAQRKWNSFLQSFSPEVQEYIQKLIHFGGNSNAIAIEGVNNIQQIMLAGSRAGADCGKRAEAVRKLSKGQLRTVKGHCLNSPRMQVDATGTHAFTMGNGANGMFFANPDPRSLEVWSQNNIFVTCVMPTTGESNFTVDGFGGIGTVPHRGKCKGDQSQLGPKRPTQVIQKDGTTGIVELHYTAAQLTGETPELNQDQEVVAEYLFRQQGL